MAARHPSYTPALMLSTVLALACAGATRTTGGHARDYAYARARDSLVVAVSARSRSTDEIQRALESAAARAAREEGCEPGTLQLRGESDARLAADALGYVAGPHRVAVVACAERPATLRPADLRTLQWIVGTWRGTGDGQSPFYERYRFVDDSTLLVETFRDSTLAEVSESTRYELRGGRFANAGLATAPQWTAVRLADGAITFAPVRRARNRFTWRRLSADQWIADLAWPAADASGAPRTRTYRMERWTSPAR
jgi:hypothetical protein